MNKLVRTALVISLSWAGMSAAQVFELDDHETISRLQLLNAKTLTCDVNTHAVELLLPEQKNKLALVADSHLELKLGPLPARMVTMSTGELQGTAYYRYSELGLAIAKEGAKQSLLIQSDNKNPAQFTVQARETAKPDDGLKQDSLEAKTLGSCRITEFKNEVFSRLAEVKCLMTMEENYSSHYFTIPGKAKRVYLRFKESWSGLTQDEQKYLEKYNEFTQAEACYRVATLDPQFKAPHSRERFKEFVQQRKATLQGWLLDWIQYRAIQLFN